MVKYLDAFYQCVRYKEDTKLHKSELNGAGDILTDISDSAPCIVDSNLEIWYFGIPLNRRAIFLKQKRVLVVSG